VVYVRTKTQTSEENWFRDSNCVFNSVCFWGAPLWTTIVTQKGNAVGAKDEADDPFMRTRKIIAPKYGANILVARTVGLPFHHQDPTHRFDSIRAQHRVSYFQHCHNMEQIPLAIPLVNDHSIDLGSASTLETRWGIHQDHWEGS